MALTDFLKSIIAQYLINKRINNQSIDEITYSSLLKNSYSFLIMMPEEEVDFHHSIYVLEYLKKESKHTTIMTKDYRVSLINPKLRSNLIEHEIRDVNKIKLPTKKLISKLNEKNYDVVIDLNRKENLFYSYAVSQVKSKLKIGFVKKGSDKFYNFQIACNGKEPEEAYKNLVNCLQMF
ncbi:MAG: hypothetical protein IIB07_09735 [Bacteroidetes bacterium]|nr:hypothetical protein [Bacteroidota bacterium]MCH8942038.1 hypothetical protein [Bacteroidota bacterium]